MTYRRIQPDFPIAFFLIEMHFVSKLKPRNYNMSGNTFGQLFRITTAGESHGPGNVVIIDGVPPGIPLEETDLQQDLDRRRPGQSSRQRSHTYGQSKVSPTEIS